MRDQLMLEKDKAHSLDWLLLSLFVLILDQLSKNYVVTSFQLYETKPIMSWLNLTLAYNTGAAFSFLNNGGGWQRWLFIGIGLGVSSWLVIWLYQTSSRHKLLACGLALIVGGALGNVWDRILLGYVIDFIEVYYRHWHWPAFNVADSAICVGAFMVALSIYTHQRVPKHSW